MSDKSDTSGEAGPDEAVRPRNKIPTAKHIAYELPGNPGHTYTCRPAPSSKRHDETEDEWLERTRAKYVPAEATNVRIESD